MYEDFLSINNDLIDTKLKRLLLKHSNNEKDVDFLYDKIVKRRNICCLFPFKHCDPGWNIWGSDYISLINQFNKNKNDNLKRFCILYNCIASIFVADSGGLDKYIFKSKETVETSHDLSHFCQNCIFVSMSKTEIFGKNEKETYDSIVSRIVSNAFRDDLRSFKKLLEYCVRDIKFNDNMEKMKDVYKLNDEQGKGYYGISFYVLNRLAYVLYHDLSCIEMQNYSELLFPLGTFYDFFYNFAVYCHCHIHCGASDDDTKRKENEGLFCDDMTCVSRILVL